jgi:hypothetical protein
VTRNHFHGHVVTVEIVAVILQVLDGSRNTLNQFLDGRRFNAEAMNVAALDEPHTGFRIEGYVDSNGVAHTPYVRSGPDKVNEANL